MNTGSVGAFTLSSVQPMYNATKSFVVHFTRCLYHFREQGIRVNVVCPGPSPTPLFLAGRDVPRIKESFKELQTRLIPIDEVVRAMVIAIEDESLAGAVLRADAGQIDIFNPDTLASKVLHKL
jgi:NAD(P)-dependent dehydrogenase (short-subunit alcohol dehydrogenase family)